jgi:hypothetical protein
MGHAFKEEEGNEMVMKKGKRQGENREGREEEVCTVCKVSGADRWTDEIVDGLVLK